MRNNIYHKLYITDNTTEFYYSGLSTFDVFPEDNAIRLVSNPDGKYRSFNGRINLTPFINSYDIIINNNIGKCIEVDKDTQGLIIRGRRKHPVEIPSHCFTGFPSNSPVWTKICEKTALGESTKQAKTNLVNYLETYFERKSYKNNIIEFYRSSYFNGLVIRDACDPAIPDMEGCNYFFGSKFRYLGKSIRFRLGDAKLNKLLSLITCDNNCNQLVAYRADNNDIIVTNNIYERVIFRELDTADSPEAKEIADISDISSESLKHLFDVLNKVDSMLSESDSKAVKRVIDTYEKRICDLEAEAEGNNKKVDELTKLVTEQSMTINRMNDFISRIASHVVGFYQACTDIIDPPIPFINGTQKKEEKEIDIPYVNFSVK